ncbi:MAG: nucleotidyltransferase substrate binding protein [Acidobacteriota bacterium]|jgi:nucleotidyltransferase substrate binding protein (TIGR01987 family)|nr:nucleotidyltransferase substrate binding protein [Acidobacteriota bacterium]
MITDDIRWIQRFNSYKKALAVLERTVAAAQERKFNEIEEQGLIQGFEFTFELSWKLLKDYLESKGFTDFHGSKDTFRLAFQEGLISDGPAWMEMIDNRNRSSRTYEESVAKQISHLVLSKYFLKFKELSEKMNYYLPQ